MTASFATTADGFVLLSRSHDGLCHISEISLIGFDGGLPAQNHAHMTTVELPFSLDRAAVARFCQERGIRRLSLFGSILRPDFDPVRSDVDVLVELCPEAQTGFRFFGYAAELAAMFGRKVDLNTPAMLSPLFRAEVQREALPIYEQA